MIVSKLVIKGYRLIKRQNVSLGGINILTDGNGIVKTNIKRDRYNIHQKSS